jgi:membrane protein implicated in regulation of membrane protease activity
MDGHERQGVRITHATTLPTPAADPDGRRLRSVDDPEVWRWIWLVGLALFGVAELVTPVAFLFLPIAAGAGAATVAAFLGLDVALEVVVFLLVTAVSYGVLWPIGRRIATESGTHHRTGANRWIGREAVVLDEIPAGTGETGTVRLDRERWRAETVNGEPVPVGSTVLVTRVDGTRLVVLPLDVPPPSLDPGAPS